VGVGVGVGAGVGAARVPVPVNRVVNVLTLVATDTVAERAPTALGSNTTSTVHEAPPASAPDGVQVPPVAVKSEAPGPVMAIPLGSIDTGSPPEFVTVMDCAVEGPASVARAPKDNEPGLTDKTTCHCAHRVSSAVIGRLDPTSTVLPEPFAAVFQPRNSYPLRTMLPGPATTAFDP